MYRFFPPILFTVMAALMAACPLLMAQPMMSPASILAEADAAHARMKTATYGCRIVSNVNGDSTDLSAGISLVRLGYEDAIGFKVRFDVEGGSITHDGRRSLYLNNLTRKLVELDSSTSFLITMDGHVYGRMVNYLFRPDTTFASAAGSARFEGTGTADGVECYIISIRDPDMADLTDRISRYYFGINDHILRRQEISALYQGMPATETMTVTDMRLDRPLPDSLFTTALPEGYAFEFTRPYTPPPILANGTAAPEWTLPDVAGKNISLAGLKGKVVVLDFWYIACPPCLRVMPRIENLHRKFDRNDVVFIGINIADSETKVTEFARAKGFTYDFLFNGKSAANSYRVSLYPTMYVIGRDGTILHGHEGDTEDMETELEAAIREAMGRK